MVVFGGVERAPAAVVMWVAMDGGGRREKKRKREMGEEKRGRCI